MINYIEVSSKIPIPMNRNLICYCPDWCDSGYQIAHHNGLEFVYDEQHNDLFSDHVEKWAIFLEAD